MTSNWRLQRCSADAYLEVVHGQLARALRDGVSMVAEPRHVVGTARAEMAKIVEVVAGFALGTVLGGLFDGVRRWYGADACRELQRRVTTSEAEQRGHVDVRYLADGEARPLVDAFAARLHVRFARLERDVRSVVDAMAARDGSEVVLFLASREEDIERRVRAEIEFAWQTFVALVTRRPLPELTGRTPRSEAMWSAWRETVMPVATMRDAAQAAGYILLVG
jgi:hypothetical protein